MDVERLMKDLTVEQLSEIYTSLSKEIETKKEELRQMVGRRYRDVLEASNTVKRLNELSDAIVRQLGETRTVLAPFEKRPVGLEQSKAKRLTTQRFILLNAVTPLLDEPINGITDVFILLLAECLQRSIALDGTGLSPELEVLIKALGDQLINHRLKLKQRLMAELGDITEWTSLAGQLVGIGMLNQTSPEALMKSYLEARLLAITGTLESSTLIGIIGQIKETTEVMDKVFGSGKGLYLCFNTVTKPGWCPDIIRTTVNDQLSIHTRLFETELTKANRSYRTEFTQVPADQVVQAVAQWTENLCSEAKENVSKIARFFERTDELVDFVLAANELFRNEWPGVENPRLIYRRLFGEALFQRFAVLIGSEIKEMESELVDRIPKVNCNPPPLFHKRATKFDGLLASGVSQELNAVVQKFFERLRNLNHRTNKYIQLGHEENVEELRKFIVKEVIAFLKRITEKHSEEIANRDLSVAVLPSDENQRWLKEFRLYLALVQFEPSIISQCMGDDTESAVEANKVLHQAAETALCHLMDYIIDEAVQDTELNKLKESCEVAFKFVDYVQNCERIPLGTVEKPKKEEPKQVEVDLNEENGEKPEEIKLEQPAKEEKEVETDVQAFIEVPTQINRQLFAFLYAICRRISQNSFGHLFTRNVSVHVSTRLAEIISTLLKDSVNAVPEHTTLVLTQLLFDSRTMAQMFPTKRFVQVVEVIKNKMDVVDWKLVDEPVARNARAAVKRSAMLFGQLQTDPPTGSISSKDASQQSVIDVLPRIEGAQRIPAIPRLSKIKEEEKKAKLKAKQAAEAKRQNPEKNINLGGIFDYFMKN
ncbi:unnamed protein product [Bursaphelenchus okinawaensis]|uniref:Conserved oligomeric Golgi complex subunit 1 n=1 Tax=Bursaphelenchus okinawaensis TaxID=465554 RepID=A0A811JRG5_9BILA|nr:unnamed protein product [Bursaphelenchus okinawaensis]CAG9079742.1 unnamed protein product [Bursaphelenchus okinawaensis]